MGSFESLFQPEKAQNYDQTIKGFLMGIVLDDRDPENIGRIRVKVPQIDPDKALPNGDDGWVLRGTAFTLNETQGGRYDPIEKGTEVVLAPINGDIRQMVAICCVMNRKDKPLQEFNSALGRYGTATKGGTFEVFDDKKGSKFNSFPTGVIQSFSGDGNVTLQTKDQARMQLNKDGSSSIGNNAASTTHSPDGTVQSTSGKATTKLSPDGKITLQGDGWASLVVQQTGIKLAAPGTTNGRTLNELNGFLSAEIIIALDQLKALNAIGEQFLVDLDNPDRILQYGEKPDDLKFKFLSEFSEVLKQLSEGIVKNLPVAIDVLSQFETTIVDDFCVIIKPSIMEGLRLKLDDLVKFVKEKVGDGKSDVEIKVEELPKYFLSILTPEEKVNLPGKLEQIQRNLKALSHDPEWMIQLIVATLVPRGWTSIETLVGLGIYDKIVDLERTINPKVGELSAITKEAESKWWEDLKSRIEATVAKLPDDLQQLASKEGLDEAFKTALGSDKITESDHSLIYSGTLLGSLWGCSEGVLYKRQSQLPLKSVNPNSKDETPDKTQSKDNPEDVETDEIDYEQLKTLLVPGESPLPVLIGLLLQNLVQESLERLKEIRDQEDSVNTIASVLTLTEFLRGKDSEAEGNREKLVELLKKVEEDTTAPVDTDEEKQVPELAAKAIKETLPKAGEMLFKRISPKLEFAFSKTFNRLLDAIPTVPTGAEIEMSNQKISLQSGDRGLGAMVQVEASGASIFGPQFDEDGKSRPEFSVAKSDIAFKVGQQGPIFRMDRRVTEMLGAEREEDLNTDEILTTTTGDFKFEDMAGGGKSGDKSKAWDRPSEEATYRVAKDGSFKPFDLTLSILPGGTKIIPDESLSQLNKKPKGTEDPAPELNKDPKATDDSAPELNKDPKDPKLNKKPKKCTVRASMTLERTGAAVMRSGLKGGVVATHNKKAEVYGPEVKDPQGNPFRSNLFAYEDQAGGQAGPSGGVFYVSPDISEFLAPERGDGEYRILESEKSKKADSTYEVRTDCFRVSDSGELENYTRKVEAPPTTRSGFSADKLGRIVARSGDKGSYMVADGNKLQVFGPETEDGTRYQIVTTDEIAGIVSGAKDGAITFVNGDRAQVFGPKKDGIRSTMLAKGAEILTSAGGKGASTLLSQVIGEFVGPDGKRAMKIAEDVLKVIGGNASIFSMSDTLTELLGPGAGKALKLSEGILNLIGGNGSVVNMMEGIFEALGVGGTQGLRVLPGIASLFGGGGSVEIVGSALNILGVGGAGLSLAQGALQMFSGGEGGFSLGIGPNGITSKGGQGGFSIDGAGSAIISKAKTVFKNATEDGENAIGFILDPETGFASLSSFFGGEWNQPTNSDGEYSDNNPTLEHQSARVGVNAQTVILESLDEAGESLHKLEVKPEGVFLNETNLAELGDMVALIPDLIARLESLESSQSGGSSGA